MPAAVAIAANPKFRLCCSQCLQDQCFRAAQGNRNVPGCRSAPVLRRAIRDEFADLVLRSSIVAPSLSEDFVKSVHGDSIGAGKPPDRRR